VLIEFSNGPVKKYRQVSQEFFEKAIGASEYSADGTSSTGNGTYAGLDANGNPIFR
jgi:hypothetical protein